MGGWERKEKAKVSSTFSLALRPFSERLVPFEKQVITIVHLFYSLDHWEIAGYNRRG